MEKRYAIGVDLGGTNIATALVDVEGKIIARSKIPTNAQAGAEEVIKRMKQTIQDVLQKANVAKEKIQGIGIGVPGLPEARTGVVRYAPNLPGWDNIPLKKIMEDEFKLLTEVENDANAAALGEKRCGAGKDVDTMVCMTLGTGVGGGIIINNKVYQGFGGCAGELGHITVEKAGPQCNCGNRGCLETLAAAPAIARRTVEVIKNGEKTIITELVNGDLNRVNAAVVSKAVENGDALARRIMDETAEYLGIGLATIINLLNPGMITIGGGVAQAGEILFAPMREVVKARAMGIPAEMAKIVPAQLGDDAGVIGAAMLVF